jgi:lipid-A-disaccharide synthase
MKYYIIAGEASGDLHASNLIRELKKNDPQFEIRGWGGDLMADEGATIVKHYRELAFMGFVEVLMNMSTILKNLRDCKSDIRNFQPDVVILVDYPGFNLRIARWAKEAGYPVVYYISPQVWAWKESRVKDIRKYVDKMLVILPFEKSFYKERSYDVEYIGHPLVDVISKAQTDTQPLPPATGSPLNEKNIIALLPGSRKQEIAKKLPVMLEVSGRFPDHRFIVAKASSIDDDFYQQFTGAYPNVRTIRNKTYQLLMQAKAALVTSGTATLETALFGVPQVVCYKGSPVSYQIAKRVIKVKYISLVNLIMDRPVVKELIQSDLTAENVDRELRKILFDKETILRMKRDYAELKSALSEEGSASAKAASLITDFVTKRLTISV